MRAVGTSDARPRPSVSGGASWRLHEPPFERFVMLGRQNTYRWDVSPPGSETFWARSTVALDHDDDRGLLATRGTVEAFYQRAPTTEQTERTDETRHDHRPVSDRPPTGTGGDGHGGQQRRELERRHPCHRSFEASHQRNSPQVEEDCRRTTEGLLPFCRELLERDADPLPSGQKRASRASAFTISSSETGLVLSRRCDRPD